MAKRRRRRAPAATAQPGDEETVSSSSEDVPGEREAPRSPKEYLNLPYKIALRADEQNGGWTAYVEELPGCDAHGDSPENATRRLRGAMERWISEALERGEHIPEPRALSGHSGRLLLRMPQSLHSELARAADSEGISLNQFITTALASAVGWRNHSGSDSRPASADDSSGGARPVRTTRRRDALLATNLVVLIFLAALAVVLLVIAWQQT